MGDEPYVPTTIPVNIHSLENELYLVDFATVPGDLEPSLTRIIRKPSDSNGHTLVIEDASGSVFVDGVNLKGTDPITGEFLGLNKYILIKDITDFYGQAVNTPEPFIPMGGPSTTATPIPPNVPGVPSFPARGPIDAPQVPSEITLVNDYVPPSSIVPPANPTGGVSPYNYYIGHPYRDETVVDIKKPEFGIFQVTDIDTSGSVDLITLTRTRESLDILPGSQIYVCLGNVNRRKQFIFTSTDEYFALCYSGKKPGFVYDNTVRVILTGNINDITMKFDTIASTTLASPITVTTTGAHTFIDGDRIIISGSNSIPSIDGAYTIFGTVPNISFMINISGGPLAPGSTIGDISTAISGIATQFLTELKIGDTITLEENGSLVNRTVTAINNQEEIDIDTALTGPLTNTILLNYEILGTGSQSVIANYTLVTSGIAGAVFGNGTAFKIYNNADFDFNNVLTIGDKIFVDAPSNQVFTVTVIDSATEITVTPTPGIAFTNRQLYLFASSSLITGRFTTFNEDSVLGRIRIGSKLVLDPTSIANREKVIISAILSNNALIVETAPTGDTHVCVDMEFCEESDIIIKSVVAETADPLTINEINVDTLNVCGDIHMGIDVAPGGDPGDCGFYQEDGTFEIGPAVKIVGQPVAISDPLWLTRYTSNINESYQFTNWITSSTKSDGVTPATPPDTIYPNGLAGPPPLAGLPPLEIFSQDPTSTISFMGSGIGFYAPSAPNNLTNIADITTSGTTIVDTLMGTSTADLTIAAGAGFDIDFSNEDLININQLILEGTAKITTTLGSGDDLTISPDSNVTTFANTDIEDVNLIVTDTARLNTITSAGISIDMLVDLDMNSNDILNIGNLTGVTALSVANLTVTTTFSAVGVTLTNTGGALITSIVNASTRVETPLVTGGGFGNLSLTATGGGSDVSITTTTGDVIITPGVAGGIDMNTTIGDITMDTTTGDIALTTSSTGDILLTPGTGQSIITGATLQAGNIAAATVLGNDDSGTWYSVTMGIVGFAITLPSPPSPGVSYKFFIDTAALSSVTISNAAAHLYGTLIDGTPSVSSIVSATTLTFVGATAVVGDTIEIYAVDATHYYVKAVTSAVGGIIAV